MATIKRCEWAEGTSSQEYHDLEWGVPVHDDRLLFEFLTLEGAQAGLNWAIILAKRDNYKKAFTNFDANVIARYDQQKIEELLLNAGIIRNKLKIHSVIANAKALLAVEKEFGSFDRFIWSFVGGKPIQNSWDEHSGIPAKTELSDRMNKALKKRGFAFVGSTICYAFMQAVGMVNDHMIDCFRYEEIYRMRT